MSSKKKKWEQDYLLVKDFMAGNHEMGRMLYDELDDLLVAFLHKKLDSYLLTADDIYDLKVDIICKTLVDIHKYNGHSRFSTWVLGYAKNYVYLKITEIMKEQQKVNQLVMVYDNFYEEPLTILMNQEYKDYIQKHLELLKYEQYIIVYYRFFEWMSFPEISDTLSLPITTIHSRYYCAIKLLRKSFLEDCYEEYI